MNNFQNSQDIDYTRNQRLFFELCRNELEHHAQRKKKYIRGNTKGIFYFIYLFIYYLFKVDKFT